MPLLRLLTRDDLPEIWRVRYAVRENMLQPGRIADAEVIERIETTGRGWGLFNEITGELLGFAIACTERGGPNAGRIWALFVHPEHAGRGHGRRLHDEMIGWLREHQPHLACLWLGTEHGSRAASFYRRAGWVDRGPTEHGEIRFELPLDRTP